MVPGQARWLPESHVRAAGGTTHACAPTAAGKPAAACPHSTTSILNQASAVDELPFLIMSASMEFVYFSQKATLKLADPKSRLGALPTNTLCRWAAPKSSALPNCPSTQLGELTKLPVLPFPDNVTAIDDVLGDAGFGVSGGAPCQTDL